MKSGNSGGITSIEMSDRSNVVGFGKIRDFRGETMHINPYYLKKAVGMADTVFEDFDDIEIGITNETLGGAFFIFLNKSQTAALVVAGRDEE